MANEFRLPDIGEGLVEVDIVRWLVPIGGHVKIDQPIVEVETEKAVMDIPSPFAGTVLHHGAAEGQVLAVGEILFVVGEAGEAWEPGAAPPTSEPQADDRPIVGTLGEADDVLPPRPEVGSSPIPTDAPGPPPRPSSPQPAPENGVTVGPLIRQLAAELDVDLQSVRGSGPTGRIRREDVLTAARPDARTETPPAASAPTVPAPGGNGRDRSRHADERRPMSKLRRTIAANLARSWAEIPHVSSFFEADATRLLEVREAFRAHHDVRVPIDALAIAAVLPALRAYPEFNSSIDGADLIVHHRRDIGVAVDTPDGLLVAVVHDAASKGLLELSAEVGRLAEGARRRSLTPAELSGQTFTVSNIGAVAGGGHGTPIIPLGTTAILAFGRATEQPVVRDGGIEIAPMMPLSFSYDHRVADGGTGRRFMTMVVEHLADPTLLLA